MLHGMARLCSIGGIRLGDWAPGPWIDLNEIREYIHSKGMKFGLWMEPEAIGAKSKLLQEHPEWAATRDGEAITGGRLLDLGNAEAQSWMESEILRLIREYKIDVFKVDYNNHHINEGGTLIRDGFVENSMWRYVETIHRAFEKVREQYPDVFIENCASGGGRNDLSMVRRSHTSSTTDFSLTPRSIKAINNLTLAYPPEVFKFYYGHFPGYHMFGDYDLLLRTAFMVNPIFVGFGPADEPANPYVKEKILHYVNLYKEFIRPIVATSRVFHHTGVADMQGHADWCVMEFAAPDKLRGYAGIFRMEGLGGSEYMFYPKGLDAARSYKVTFDNTGSSLVLSGYELSRHGLRIELDRQMSSELLLFEQILD